MQTTNAIRSIALGVVFFASAASAAAVEKAAFGVQATCSCKSKGDCTCPRGECKCKNCGNGAASKNKVQVFETLKGANETTRLPDTARYDARGGVFI
ncbi:MAG: hypothetical protein JNM17_16785 [Archangium sp.]|nr:hypothetical protein [Archangium sp.]